MMKYVISMILFAFSVTAIASNTEIVLEKAPVNIHDTASIQRGAKWFATVCMACHTLVYMRYNKIAQNAGITYERMPINLSASVYGVKPPDLSLETDVRGADWVYTYLHSFYQDNARPSKVNNLLAVNTAMPGILSVFQGQQSLAGDVKITQHIYDKALHWYDVLELQKQGTMPPAEYDAAMTDVVNFLVYSAAPYQVTQQKIGWWVLGYLVMLFVLAYLLKINYWRDVDKK